MYNLKGWFLHKGSYIFHAWHLSWAAVWIRPSAECFVHDGAAKGQELRSGAFQAPEAERKKQYSHPRSYGMGWRHWRRCYIYAFTHAHIYTVPRRRIPHSRASADKDWMSCYIQTPLGHKRTRERLTCKKLTVFAMLLLEGLCLWWAVYRSNVGGVNIF